MTQAINRIRSTLPDGVDPRVVTGSFDDLPIVQFAVTTAEPSPGLADALLAGGQITQDGQTLTFSTGTGLTSTQDIASLPLRPTTPSPQLVTIGDVATVEVTDNPVTSISYFDGQPALTVAVTRLPAANTVAVSSGTRRTAGSAGRRGGRGRRGRSPSPRFSTRRPSSRSRSSR